jgi:hypothetical protein
MAEIIYYELGRGIGRGDEARKKRRKGKKKQKDGAGDEEAEG